MTKTIAALLTMTFLIPPFSETYAQDKSDNLSAEQILQQSDMSRNGWWIYMPDTRKPIRITPLQRLMGDVSNGDVARTRYAEDYSATLLRSEVLEGTPCYVLDLKAKRDGATYNHIIYWVAKGTDRPKRAEIYLTSGKHYKSIDFDKYEKVNGRVLLTRMTITDRLRNGRTTIMKYDSYAPKNFPEKYFNKDYLENLR
ncbi:MAG: outer membrane lipoprotein-sorting protein [Bacteroidetes bacterium]|nr:outer membrane lipoprotein-sorting protein [Bacteroidota bacterium]